MDLRKIALGLLFGGALAAGSVACDSSSSSSSSSSTSTGDAGLPTPCATIGSDTDSASTPAVTITHLGLPASDGFNIDGINNAPRGGTGGGSGATVAGCGKTDLAGGKDNGLAAIAASLATVIDLNSSLQSAITNGLMIKVQLNHLSAADAANDSCVGALVTVQNGASGTPVNFTGSGSLTNHVASVAFDQDFSFSFALSVPSTSCNVNPCPPGNLAITVRKPVARVTLNATNTQMQAGSLLGGFVFYEDAAYSSTTNMGGFKAQLTAFATQIQLMASLLTQADQAFSGAEDLHMDEVGTLSNCTSPTNSTTNTNRNSVSVALSIDTL